MARRMPKPDLRPKWSDPNLSVIRNYRFANGKVMTEVHPDYEHRYREAMMDMADVPKWREDNTYFARRKR